MIPQEDTNKILAWEKLNLIICLWVMIGTIQKNGTIWKKFKELNVKIIYFPYTQSCSTTLIKKKKNFKSK